MKKEQDYLRDLADIRAMMEKSSKFLSLSGWAGILAGIYALVGAFIIHSFDLVGRGDGSYDTTTEREASPALILVALGVLIATLLSAYILSVRKARQRDEQIWNSTSKRMLGQMAVPLLAGGLLAILFYAHNMLDYLAPTSLIFYGLALHNAGSFSFVELRGLGIIEVALGLLAACFPDFGILFWSLGFGLMHIIYGLYIYMKYER